MHGARRVTDTDFPYCTEPNPPQDILYIAKEPLAKIFNRDYYCIMQFTVAKKPKNPIVFQERLEQTVTTTSTSSFFIKISYGARYLDPRTSRWISGDPAIGEYIPQAGKGGKGLPGMGGIYNNINFHCFAYAGNNPIKLIDPDGREPNRSNVVPKLNLPKFG